MSASATWIGTGTVNQRGPRTNFLGPPPTLNEIVVRARQRMTLEVASGTRRSIRQSRPLVRGPKGMAHRRARRDISTASLIPSLTLSRRLGRNPNLRSSLKFSPRSSARLPLRCRRRSVTPSVLQARDLHRACRPLRPPFSQLRSPPRLQVLCTRASRDRPIPLLPRLSHLEHQHPLLVRLHPRLAS